jgi:DNA polymerase-3 subunit epsilon
MHTSTELRDFANALAASEDYRVLTRLPVLDEAPAIPPEKPAGSVRAMILDTETTGIDTKVDKVVELGALVFDFDPETGALLQLAGTYAGLSDPGIPIQAEASRVSGITDEMVRGQQLDGDRVAGLLGQTDLVIAHNAGFDRKIMEACMPRFTDKAWACSQQDLAWVEEGIGGQKLDYIAYRYGFFYDGHRAIADCLALLEILRRPLPTSGESALVCLLRKSSQKSHVVYAQGAPYDKKDDMKARGYRWIENTKISGGKAWGYTLNNVSGMEIFDEIDWLRANVYNGRKFTVAIETVDAHSRFSARGGEFHHEVV